MDVRVHNPFQKDLEGLVEPVAIDTNIFGINFTRQNEQRNRGFVYVDRVTERLPAQERTAAFATLAKDTRKYFRKLRALASKKQLYLLPVTVGEIKNSFPGLHAQAAYYPHQAIIPETILEESKKTLAHFKKKGLLWIPNTLEKELTPPLVQGLREVINRAKQQRSNTFKHYMNVDNSDLTFYVGGRLAGLHVASNDEALFTVHRGLGWWVGAPKTGFQGFSGKEGDGLHTEYEYYLRMAV